MSGFKVNFSVNNQLSTPSIHAAPLAQRPAAGQPGRVFIDSDNPSTGIYRDTGTTWVVIGMPSSPDVDTLQTVTDRGNTTTQSITVGAATVPVGTIDVRRTAVSLNNANDYGVVVNTAPTIPNGANFSISTNINAVTGSQLLTFAGNATLGNQNVLAAGFFTTSIGSSGAGTITVDQAATVRAPSAIKAFSYFNTNAATTITHNAGILIGQPINSGSNAATVTNNFMLIVSDSTPQSGTINYTNRWGIYQEGTTDRNYFAGNCLLGTTVDAGYRLNVSGILRNTSDAYFATTSGNVGIGTTTPSSQVNYTGLTINNTGPGSASGSFVNLNRSGVETGQFLASGTVVALAAIPALPLSFQTNGSERMRIFSNGNIAVGTSVDAGQKFQVNGTSSLGGDVTITTTTNARTLTISRGSATNSINFQSSTAEFTFQNQSNFVLNVGNGTFQHNSTRLTFSGFQNSSYIEFKESSTNTQIFYIKNGDTQQWNWAKNLKIDGSTSASQCATSSLLELSSTTLGFLPPRMTDAQITAITTPAAGLMVYSTTQNCPAFYDGTGWRKVSHSAL